MWLGHIPKPLRIICAVQNPWWGFFFHHTLTTDPWKHFLGLVQVKQKWLQSDWLNPLILSKSLQLFVSVFDTSFTNVGDNYDRKKFSKPVCSCVWFTRRHLFFLSESHTWFYKTEAPFLLLFCFSSRSDAVAAVLRRPGAGFLERPWRHRGHSLVHRPHVPHQAAVRHSDAGQCRAVLHHQPHGKE